MSHESQLCAVDASYWVRPVPAAAFEQRGAAQILEAVEAGLLSVEADIKVSPDARAIPLRRLLRELVWTAFQEGGLESPPAAEVEAPFRTAFARGPVAMVLCDLNGRLIEVNEAFAALLGRPAADFVGMPVGALSDPEVRADELAMGAEMFAGRRTGFTVEKEYRHADGRPIPALLSVSLVRKADGQPERVVATILDLRERLELERRRREEAELAAIQRVASGVAHDLGNVLSVIQLSTGLLRESEVGQAEELTAIEQATQVAGNLSQQLQHLARPPAARIAPLDLAAALDRLSPMLRRLLPEGLRLELGVEGSPFAQVDPNDLEQILLNLVVNAGQHGKPQGRVRITAQELHGGALLRVEDDGAGMTEEVRARALEPFFSARPGGTGLGLAIVQAAAQRAQAQLELWSVPGGGARFTLRFPPIVTP